MPSIVFTASFNKQSGLSAPILYQCLLFDNLSISSTGPLLNSRPLYSADCFPITCVKCFCPLNQSPLHVFLCCFADSSQVQNDKLQLFGENLVIIILDFVHVIKNLMVRKQCIIHNGNLDDRLQTGISIFSICLGINIPATIDQCTVCPEPGTSDLHFYKNDGAVVEMIF